jgi:glycosyltransferase involved in cell wall biosynthesis
VSPKTVPVSVVICTRDRPRDLERCLESVARLDPQPLEVLVVDQGSEPRLPAIQVPRVRHCPMNSRGLSRARNLGLELARGEIVAFLDDDCTVGPTWAGDVAATFERHPDAGVVFGAVVADSTDLDEYVPAYLIPRERRLKGRASARRAHGIGAAMYLRATTAAAVGEFDPRLGAGGEFRSSEDWDYTFRALATGAVVVETPSVSVRHFGGRRYSDGTAGQLLRWNAFSHGAVHAKLLRCGDPIGLVLVVNEVASLVSLLRPLNALAGMPTNAARLAMYARGLVAGSRRRVRRNQRLFAEATAET